MTPLHVLAADEIDLADIDFWARPLAEREGAFQTLRANRPIGHWDEPDLSASGIPKGNGFYALTKYDDIVDVSRQPDLFCSGKGATSITDLPEFMNDFFGSMINMDGSSVLYRPDSLQRC